MKSPITTHVLDVSVGRPAAGIDVRLARFHDDEWRAIGHGVTDADGRATQLLAPGSLHAGTYRLTFAVGDYFASKTFYPHVDIVFVVEKADEHYHVPLLLSPYGYSTYRGS